MLDAPRGLVAVHDGKYARGLVDVNDGKYARGLVAVHERIVLPAWFGGSAARQKACRPDVQKSNEFLGFLEGGCCGGHYDCE